MWFGLFTSTWRKRAQRPRIGVEIEYLTTDRAGGPVRSGYKRRERPPRSPGLKVLRAAARLLQPGLDPTRDRRAHVNVYAFSRGKLAGACILPDTFTLLETVTAPTKQLAALRAQLWAMKSAIVKAAEQLGNRISGAACPVAYPYNALRSQSRVTCNNAGMHVHVEGLEDRVKAKLANYITQFVPELTALSVNSPVYNGRVRAVNSFRLDSSPLVSARRLRVFRCPDEDGTLEPPPDDAEPRFKFLTPFTNTGKTVEIRGFDTPITIDWAVALAALVQCLAAKARRDFVERDENTVLSGCKAYRDHNYEAALKRGLKAKFVVDPTFHQKPAGGKESQPVRFLYHTPDAPHRPRAPAQCWPVQAHLAAKRMLWHIEREAVELGAVRYLRPLYDAVRRQMTQADQQKKWFASGRLRPFMQRLNRAARAAPRRRFVFPVVRGRYFVVRDAAEEGDVQTIYLSARGAKRARRRRGQAVWVSGPRGVFRSRIAIAQDDTLDLGPADIALTRAAQDRLGVALLDPVILDRAPRVPFCVRWGGKEWTPRFGPDYKPPAPEPEPVEPEEERERAARPRPALDAVPLIVHQGYRNDPDDPPCVRMSERDMAQLGLVDGDTARLRPSRGGEPATVMVRAGDTCQDGEIRVRNKLRETLGVDIGGRLIAERPAAPGTGG